MNKDANFNRYESYEIVADKSKILTLDEQRVERALFEQLNKNNLNKVDIDGDVSIQYQLIKGIELTPVGTTVSLSYGLNNIHGAFVTPDRYYGSEYTNLVIKVIDNETKQVVWEARSSKKLFPTMNSDERDELIVDEVLKMFESYP
jgi:hypothetical protein